jgi:hypothetical protein
LLDHPYLKFKKLFKLNIAFPYLLRRFEWFLGRESQTQFLIVKLIGYQWSGCDLWPYTPAESVRVMVDPDATGALKLIGKLIEELKRRGRD